MNDIKSYMKKYFEIDSTVKIQGKKINIRKDGVITKPIRLYILTNSVNAFCNKIGFEGTKQCVAT
jgi:hypothetical protein